MVPVWVDRRGKERQAGASKPRRYVYPRMSPDGTRVLLGGVGDDRDAPTRPSIVIVTHWVDDVVARLRK